MTDFFVKIDEKKRALQEKIETELSNWNPKEASSEQITSDPFKTIFVGGLKYSVTERQVKREFERFGEVKKVSIVKEKDSGKPRGYAFVEFERERDVKSKTSDYITWRFYISIFICFSCFHGRRRNEN